MRENGGGTIVNMSSLSGKIGLAGQTNYSAAKAGIVGLSKAAAKERALAKEKARHTASVALFLASDMSSYMTGTVLEVTGGRFM